MQTLHQKKLKIAQEILNDINMPIWLIYSESGSDPNFERLVGVKEITPAILILTPSNYKVIVNTLDADNFKDDVRSDNLITYSGRDYDKPIVDTLKEFNFRNKLALNYTTIDDDKTDIIRAGKRDYIDNLIKNNFKELFSKKDPIRKVAVSGEEIAYALYDRKIPEEIEIMRLAAIRANNILEQAFKKIEPGMSDLKAYRIVQEIKEDTKKEFIRENDLLDEDYAWDSKGCPIALTGKSFEKGGHAKTCGEIIKPGNTVYFDFGVKLHSKDGVFCSDIQRIGYVLREEETKPSEEAQKIFDVLYEAVSKGIETLRPDKKGFEVDDAVRNIILKAHYPDYDHATGHPIGNETHNPGTLLRKKTDRFDTQNLYVQLNGVYTIEPRIPITNGGSIEEMVLVGKEKNETLCPRQEKLYLIR